MSCSHTSLRSCRATVSGPKGRAAACPPSWRTRLSTMARMASGRGTRTACSDAPLGTNSHVHRFGLLFLLVLWTDYSSFGHGMTRSHWVGAKIHRHRLEHALVLRRLECNNSTSLRELWRWQVKAFLGWLCLYVLSHRTPPLTEISGNKSYSFLF